MSEHDELYGQKRQERLKALLRELAERIQALYRRAELLAYAPELLARLGDVRSELFHYEVRSTYDTPEIADSRRIVDEAEEAADFTTPDPEDDEPWRPPE